MEDKIYIKRSCFALKGMFDIAQLRSTLSENKIKDIALYKNEKFNFIIVDFDINYDEIDIKQMLKEKLDKSLKNNNIQYIKNSKRVFKKNHDQPHYLRDGSIFKRLVMNLEIKNDASLLKEYIEVHKPENIWTEIIENMDTMGIAESLRV
jgi:L-rhamnose mutarotase